MKEFDATQDKTQELAELFKGANPRYIYSQLSFFLMLVITNEENKNDSTHDLSTFLGLLSDSYFGIKVTNGTL